MQTGLVLGKFSPLHVGHEYLIRFALNFNPNTTVLVDNIKNQELKVSTRVSWIKSLFPEARVIGLTRSTPQEPSNHAKFWEFWKKTIEAKTGKVDQLFASTNYARELADTLDAELISCDVARKALPISATLLKTDLPKYWDYLSLPAKRHYHKHVVFMGPESTGKTFLAKQLRAELNCGFVPEYAEEYLQVGGILSKAALHMFIKAQLASYKALTYLPQYLTISDTDYLSTILWGKKLFSDRIPLPKNVVPPDLTLLFSPNTPWLEASHRNNTKQSTPKSRYKFFYDCKMILEKNNRPYKIIDGDTFEARKLQVIQSLKLL